MGKELAGQKFDAVIVDEVSMALHISSLCNSAFLKKEGERHSIVGDPTEGALLAIVNQHEKRANRRHNKYLLKFVITSASMYTIITGLKKAEQLG